LFLENFAARVAQDEERYMLLEGFYKRGERRKWELMLMGHNKDNCFWQLFQKE
jgi:hypothetical protein